jgi:thermitase
MLRKFADSAFGRVPVVIVALGLLCLGSSALAGGGRLMKTDTSKQTVIPDETPSPTQVYTTGNLVVKLYASDSVTIDQVNSQFGTAVDKYLANLRLYLLTIPEGADPDLLAAEVTLSPWVEYAQPNYVTDPLNPVQGSYPFPDLTHQGDFDGQEAASLLQLTSVHQTVTGAGVTVGVLDGGFDYTHPRFNGRVVSGWDYVDDDSNAMDEPGGDNSGHGTFVAGVVALMAPDAVIRAYRVSDIDGRSEGYLLAEAIMQAVDDGCDIINLSLAMTHPHAAVGDALRFAVDNGVLVVAAAGNGGVQEVRYPASDQNALAVAAIDSLGLLAEFSNYGPEIDVCAPGAWIYSPFRNDGYAWWDGTSFAAPFVAGQAALLKARSPLASVGQLRSAIMVSADDLEAANPGYIGYLGQGLIDPLAALNLFAGSDSATVWPDTISLSVPLGTMDTIIVAALVTSSNAPANFIAEVINTGDRFVQLLQSTGMTDDSLMIAVFPGWPFSGGLWHNTVSIQVEGTSAPVELVIELNLTQGGGATAWIDPDFINLTIPYGWLGMVSEMITVNSSNGPAFYSVNGGSFTIVQDSTGLTGDSAYVHFDHAGLPPGAYCDTLLFSVVGVSSPAALVVCLTITADTTGPASAWTTPASLSFTLPAGADTLIACVSVNSTNAPASFTIQYDTSGFISVPTLSGMTNGSACVIVDPNGYSVGSYCDSILIFVDSINGPISLPVCMTITDSAGGGTDTAWASPSFVSVQVTAGSTDSIYGCLSVGSTNQPAPLYGDILRPNLPPDVQLVYPWDTTPGNLCYVINPAGFVIPFGSPYRMLIGLWRFRFV